MAQCLLGLGSNLGERISTLELACQALNDTSGIELTTSSSWYRSLPVGGPEGQGEYLNGAAIITTSLDPHALLNVLHAVEADFGRVRSVRWGPRTLDIDLLLYGDQTIDSSDLQIPHSLMTKRLFVLEPAVEIAPNWIHPIAKLTILELLARLHQEHDQSVE